MNEQTILLQPPSHHHHITNTTTIIMSSSASNKKKAEQHLHSSKSSTPMRNDIRNKRSHKYNNNINRHSRSSSEPPKTRRHSLVEEHYRIESHSKKLLPGLPNHDTNDDARDLHDFFNLICLVPVVVLNVLNWNWDILLDWSGGKNSNKTLQDSWTGEWFPSFYAITVGYFLADLLWVLSIPQCVKSPGVIIQHHIATLLYLIIPYKYPAETGWIMGACLCVEINTWLLIARRVFNKQGFGPWVINFSCFHLRIKLISILFYITWFVIRCYIYPNIMVILCKLWWKCFKETGHVIYQKYSFSIVLHSVFCVLNFKWTFDLFRSKWRALRSGKVEKISKGL